MAASSLPAFLVTFLFALSCLWAFPEVVNAKHAGITRHYKFNVRITYINKLFFNNFKCTETKSMGYLG